MYNTHSVSLCGETLLQKKRLNLIAITGYTPGSNILAGIIPIEPTKIPMCDIIYIYTDMHIYNIYR